MPPTTTPAPAVTTIKAPKAKPDAATHRADTLTAFDADFGPFDASELTGIGKTYDTLFGIMGAKMRTTNAKATAKMIASGIIGQQIRNAK